MDFLKPSIIAASLSLLTIPAATVAQDSGDSSMTADIVVTGSRESTLDLPKLQRADAAFRAGRAKFAPSSVFTFGLKAPGGESLDGIQLKLWKQDQSIDVPVDALGNFVLPSVDSTGWELFHNRGKLKLAVRPIVMSPGTTTEDRRLGDLRLLCRVNWQLIKGGYSFIARNAFDLVGGCGSSRIAFYGAAPRPLASARVIDGGSSQPLRITADPTRYYAPLADKRLSNEARVQLQYR